MLRLALNLGTWTSAPADEQLALCREAQRLGYDVIWVAEAYGSDAATPLAWIAAHTERIGIGSGVWQIPARTPAMTAMTAATLDSLSGGRFRLGLGVSGPQVSEGWHGVRFARPVSRLREYAEAVRLALSRQPLTYAGQSIAVPPPGSDVRSMALAMRPVRERIPLYLAAVGPRALDLTGDVADGWLSSFADPGSVAEAVARLQGRRRARAADVPGDLDVTVSCPLVVTGEHDDPLAAADAVRPHAALYVGGMGGREDNVYAKIAARLGHGEAAATVQDLYLSRRREEAAAAVPAAFIDQVSLLGPPSRIAVRMRELAAAGATTLSLTPFGGTAAQRLDMLAGAAQALRLANEAP